MIWMNETGVDYTSSVSHWYQKEESREMMMMMNSRNGTKASACPHVRSAV